MTDDLASFYRRTCPALVGLLTSVGGSRSDAEEIAHDAYVALLPRWDHVRTYESPEAWVRTVALRSLISRQRRARVAWLGLRRLAHEPLADSPPPSSDSVAVAAALRTLTVGHRAVLVLHHGLDLPVEQVARELDIPVGTVKSRLARARAAVQPLLLDEERTEHERR